MTNLKVVKREEGAVSELVSETSEGICVKKAEPQANLWLLQR